MAHNNLVNLIKKKVLPLQINKIMVQKQKIKKKPKKMISQFTTVLIALQKIKNDFLMLTYSIANFLINLI